MHRASSPNTPSAKPCKKTHVSLAAGAHVTSRDFAEGCRSGGRGQSAKEREREHCRSSGGWKSERLSWMCVIYCFVCLTPTCMQTDHQRCSTTKTGSDANHIGPYNLPVCSSFSLSDIASSLVFAKSGGGRV